MGFDGLRIWFLTGSQDLYGEATLAQVGEQSAAIVAGLNAASDIPVEIVHRPTVTTPGRHPASLPGRATADDACIGVIGWMHTFSPGQDVDRGPAGAAASRSCTCTRSTVATCPTPTSTWTS